MAHFQMYTRRLISKLERRLQVGLHIHLPVKFGMIIHTVKIVGKYKLNAFQVCFFLISLHRYVCYSYAFYKSRNVIFICFRYFKK